MAASSDTTAAKAGAGGSVGGDPGAGGGFAHYSTGVIIIDHLLLSFFALTRPFNLPGRQNNDPSSADKKLRKQSIIEGAR